MRWRAAVRGALRSFPASQREPGFPVLGATMLFPLIALATPLLAAPPTSIPDARFGLALYCDPSCDPTLVAALDEALQAVESRRRAPRKAESASRVMGMAAVSEFELPDLEVLGSLAAGVSAEGRATLAGSQEVLVASFAAPRDEVRSLMSLAYPAFAELAIASGGVVEELNTGRLFDGSSLQAHGREVLAEPLDATTLFIVEVLEDEADVELRTSGLRALGLHEMRTFCSEGQQLEDMAALLNALAQLAWEQGALSERSELSEDSLVLQEARQRAAGIQGVALASSSDGIWSLADDPAVDIRFEGRFDAPVLSGDVVAEVQQVEREPEAAPASAAVEPAPVSVPAQPAQQVSPAEEPPDARPASLEEALAQAAQQLAGPVKQAWSAGLPAGDVLYIKAPFPTPDGSLEYLWIEVDRWEGNTMGGQLRSEPGWVQGLSPGDEVSVRQEVVFDYLLRRADGSSEGNRSEPFLH